MVERISTIAMRTVTVRPVVLRVAETHRGQARAGDDTVYARLLADWPTWQRVRHEGVFHLDGVVEPPGFEANRDVALRLRLRAALVEKAPDDLLAALADPDSPLSHTESWFATEVMQSVQAPTGYAELGVRTNWAEPLGPSDPGDVMSVVTSSLMGLGWEFERHDGDLIRCKASVDSDRSWVVLIPVEAESERGAVFSVHPRLVPVSARAGLALLLLEANHQLGVGAFEIDADDGEVRYRIPFTRPSAADFQEILDRNLTTMSAYYDAIASATG